MATPTKKYFHLSFQIEQANLYAVLQALEEHKAGNVEVRGVARENGNDEGTVQYTQRASKLNLRSRLIDIMPVGEKVQLFELGKKLGAKRTSVYSALAAMMKRKIVRRVGHGVFVRTKEVS